MASKSAQDHTQPLWNDFSKRHIGPDSVEIEEMLKKVNAFGLSDLIDSALPQKIRMNKDLDLAEGLTEAQLLTKARKLATKNKTFKTYIGMGYYGSHTPSVIQRNILENPAWYTAYTPYQAEISQGRMEALLNFQTMIMDLTGMPIANASLLDEGTAAAEAMALALSQNRNKATKIFVNANSFPQTIEVLKTRAEPLGVEVVLGDLSQMSLDSSYFAAFTQYLSDEGAICDLPEFLKTCGDNKCVSIVSADLLALCLIKPPGEMGADIVVGSSQRFGVPMCFGGPHAAFLATKEEFKRMIPGRIIGVSKDADGKPALRLALQTREQHIRREKATSNICTAQVLLAVMASMYGVYHGPKGLRAIADHVNQMASGLAECLKRMGFALKTESFFDTLHVMADAKDIQKIYQAALDKKINLRLASDQSLGISLDETTTPEDIEDLVQIFSLGKRPNFSTFEVIDSTPSAVPALFQRTSSYLTHPVFNQHHSETEMLRYIFSLQGKDLSLTHSMIPLGSCTMKLNSTTEMMPITWPKFANVHPFAPREQVGGYMVLIHELEKWLSEITGFAAISLQPNAGSQGEYAGLLVIKKYQEERGQALRNICLIPSSAHGTNPASAVMAGMKVVVTQCDENGNIDIDDLKAKAELHSKELCALMVTYPSTHGVFEESIIEICDLIHSHGGQVYMDGANLNALVGICQPGKIGADVCHLNLHKTFCIPHGGGGPGVGPIGVAEHLKGFLPTHSVVPDCGPSTGVSAVSAAPWGSAGILPISWAYIAMMGRAGLKRATEVAILNANYLAECLKPHYPILYKGKNGRVAHECIVDVRSFKESAGVTVDDIAKRLMDYGFHAPTMSWPVAGTLMIEPTESEAKSELDRFVEAMISIRNEIRMIEEGKADKENNVLKNAPHPLERCLSDKWAYPYSREQAAFPVAAVKANKFWPAVARVDNAYGDKNLVCSCLPIEAYQ